MKLKLISSIIFVITTLCASSSISASSAKYRCFGTEPFWELMLDSGKLTFKIHDEAAKTISIGNPSTAANISQDHLKIYKSSSRDAMLIIQKQTCSDGMSDNVYQYQSLFLMGESAYLGCCVQK